MPDTASVMPTRSGQRLRQTADSTPIAMPIVTDHAMLQTVSQNVGMKRSAISVATGRLVRSDVPKSQRTTPVRKRTNCSGSERSRPRSLRTSSTVSGVASGPAARRAGSPGSRWTKPNTSSPTISSVGTRPSRRLAMYWSNAAPHPNPLPAARGEGELRCAPSTLPLPARRGEGRGEGRTARTLLQVDFVEVERRVRNHVDARQLLVVRRQETLDDQRRPRRVVPDRSPARPCRVSPSPPNRS